LGHGSQTTLPTGHGQAVGHSHAGSATHAHLHGKAVGQAKTHSRAAGHTRTASSRHTGTGGHPHVVKKSIAAPHTQGGGLPVKVPPKVGQVVKSGTDAVKKTASSATGN
jgi:hypothetical protein